MNDEKIDKARIDWEEIKGRLEKAQSMIEKGWTPSPEEERKILRQRAQTLSEEPGKERVGEEVGIVEFLLAQERYGFETSYVREVYPLDDLTPVPCTPSFVLGIINVRGRIVSVIDLKRFFDLPDKGLGDLNKVIILRSDSMEFGVLADAIIGTRSLSLEELQTSLPTLTGVREEYLKGIATDRTIILSAERLLTDRKLVVNEEI